jgi:DNA-binding protein HU-beta
MAQRRKAKAVKSTAASKNTKAKKKVPVKKNVSTEQTLRKQLAEVKAIMAKMQKKAATTKALVKKVRDVRFNTKRISTTDLVKFLSSRNGLSKADTKAMLAAFISTIMKEVSNGRKIIMSGFGSFEKVKRKARTGRNPMTGERIMIPETTHPKFRPGREFKYSVKG